MEENIERLLSELLKPEIQDFKVEVLNCFVAEITYIARRSQQNCETRKTDATVLQRGFYYPDRYAELLGDKNPTRFNFLKERNCFYHGWVSRKYFAPITCTPSRENPSGQLAAGFKLKTGALPSRAIASLGKTACLLGCGEIMHVALYRTLNKILGDEKFNALFAANSATPLTIGNKKSTHNPISFFLTPKKEDASAKKGDVVFYSNTRLYPLKHRFGSASGFITVCCDDSGSQKKFTAVELPPEGFTKRELAQFLLTQYNLPQKAPKQISKKLLETIQTFSPALSPTSHQYQNMEDFTSHGGGKILGICEVATSLIFFLHRIPVSDVQEEFSKLRPSSRVTVLTAR